MQEAPFLRKYGFRYGFFGKNIQKLYVFPALCGHRLIKFPPAVGQSAYEGHIFDFVVALIAVALEKAVESFQKIPGTGASAAGLVIVQDDRCKPVASGQKDPHIGGGFCCPAFFMQDLACCFVCMQDIPLQQKAVQLFIKRQEVMFGAVNAPVCHCLPGRRQAKLGRQGFLPVIRQP